jgi:hypothetical protein
MAQLRTPAHVKYRREDGFGLVYDHENYGYDDATLVTVDERIIDALEFVDERAPSESELESAFHEQVVEVVRTEGYVRAA